MFLRRLAVRPLLGWAPTWVLAWASAPSYPMRWGWVLRSATASAVVLAVKPVAALVLVVLPVVTSVGKAASAARPVPA
ncbi:hypothetical protein [Mycobacterium seoulense]|uniref:Uncharacterized protein n=1 Tax=Mycobacterium seoulense TaxID=386911 RepID=A0A7I7P899_9MYCO|nr:hypothetical protein [Mycobacterium seoulense]MCV7438887.1 hypothetical protein [Mycobacterium seoulense]BBY03948.1 hypothetical protein MSEO_44470 [Mycobacterium seoulense]